jgi:5-methyltetrahydropteroyltriglutamate--homocysteine methyltransferase
MNRFYQVRKVGGQESVGQPARLRVVAVRPFSRSQFSLAQSGDGDTPLFIASDNQQNELECLTRSAHLGTPPVSDVVLPATVIGSWSFPGWFEKFAADVNLHPDLFGQADRDEAVRDAVRLAIDDQLRAGLDRITDGEMQRVDFNLGFYHHLDGLEPLPQHRRWGAPAHDQRDKYRAIRPLHAPHGLGTVAEYRRLRELTSAPIKMPVPGPFTLSGCLDGGRVYHNRQAVTLALVPIVNAELKALVAAGVDFIQLDEPSFACHPAEPEFFLETLARAVEGVSAYISMHLCFGNYRARAVAHRSYVPVLAHLARAPVNQLALEFASREMAEIERLAALPETLDLAVGLIDVKNTWIEPPELVADRLRQVLRHVDARRVSITPDCGFSQTARHVAVAKSAAMVEGARIVRNELK